MMDDLDVMRQGMIEAGVPAAYLAAGGPVWDTTGLQEDYTVDGFALGMVVVHRKADGVRGTLQFTHRPRWYYAFEEA